jgi:peptide/nickel transport system permease protein
MPERSPDPTTAPDPETPAGVSVPPGETLMRTLVAEEAAREVPPDAVTVRFAAVEAGPEAVPERRRLGVASWLAIAWLVLLAVVAVTVPFLPVDDPTVDATPALARQGPSISHPFGVDGAGRDVFASVLWGTRVSLFIAVASIVAGFVAGGVVGIVAGYFKGRIGGILGSAMDVFLAFPQLILALSIVTFLGRTVFNVTLGLAIVATPVLARIARASTLSWSEREFVLAARAQGARHLRIMVREILPNVLPAMFSIALLGVAVVIVAEGGLAIIGAGVKPDVITWGNVIVRGQGELRDAPHIVLAPSLVIFLTVLSLNYLGDVVRARFDVRESAL